MAVGETVVGTLWTSFAGICIEKLLDELLKVCSHCFISFEKTNSFFLKFSEWNQSEKIDFQRTSRHISNNNNNSNSNIGNCNVEFK
jgi:hypothetical protein